MARIVTSADPAGIIVTVDATPANPTRYALIMRRQRANAARRANGRAVLPAIQPGDHHDCAGLGVVGVERERCRGCGGTGMA